MSVAHAGRFVTPLGSTRAMKARASAGVIGLAGGGVDAGSGALAQPATTAQASVTMRARKNEERVA
jgi:hypothetical protein